jgi:hypothetical protein
MIKLEANWNLDAGLMDQAQKCGRVKFVYGISSLKSSRTNINEQ